MIKANETFEAWSVVDLMDAFELVHERRIGIGDRAFVLPHALLLLRVENYLFRQMDYALHTESNMEVPK